MTQSNFSVLYAEDDDILRERYVNLLKLYFKDVYAASNGEDALKYYEKYKPNIVLLDISMPIINGLQVAKKIRENDKSVILVILSAHSETDKLLEAIELSLTKYLIKPINTFELEELLKNCIIKCNNILKNKNILLLDGGFSWNKTTSELIDKYDATIKLTKKEFLLVSLFCNSTNNTLSSDDILNYVWEDDFNNSNTNKLRILFSKLKTKLSYSLFDSIYNVGYKIKVNKKK